jgi:YVTN family beta-propeller protein
MPLMKTSNVLLLSLAACSVLGFWAKHPSAVTHAAQKDSPAAPAGGGAEVNPPLDYQTYLTRIEPIFLKQRPGGPRCYDCHTVLATRMKLQPFSQGASSWTEEQSRRNFETVSRLVVPSDLSKSPLLLHPLAQEAGGDPAHTGGKFWASKDDPEWKMIADWARLGASGTAAAAPPARSDPAAASALDFQDFRTRVEPIFLKQRPGHARCYVCHSESNRVFNLAQLSPGSADWTEEQSQRNFQNAAQLVVPGDPGSSRLLLHPLAPEAGGDAFHSGGRQFASQNDPDWLAMSEWVRGHRDAAAPSPALHSRIYITNSGSDTVAVIDPEKNQVVQVIRGVELPHGVTFSPDGTRVYISVESENVLDVIDRKSGEILKKIALSGRPNNISITKDGARVLVGIRVPVGAVDIIDTSLLKRVKTIPVNGSAHNVYVTPDGKYAVSGSIETKVATVIDLQTDQVAWEVKFDGGVRPMTFDTNPDGSTRHIFVQLSGFNGFAVVDFAKHAQTARITLPEQPGGYGVAEGRLRTPSHGIGVAPDGKSLWVNSTQANAVFEYSLPDLTLLGHTALPVVHGLGSAPTGSVPEWITFTPDGRFLYVSNSGAGSVSAIDTKTLQIVALIPVGEVPKRINTLVLR